MLGKLLKQFNVFAHKPAPAIAIYVGSQAISVVDIASDGRLQFTIEALNSQPIPEMLRQLLSNVKKRSRVQLVLAPELYQLVQLDKPALADEEITLALPWQVKDLVTIAVEDMVADYIDSPSTTGQAEKITVVVASIAALKPLVNEIINADLQLISIQPEEWLASCLIPPKQQASMLVIQQPDQEMLIQIFKDGVLYFSRRSRGFSRMRFHDETQWQTEWLDRVQLELQRSMDYFESQLKQAPVRDIGLLMSSAQPIAQLLNVAGFSRVNTVTPASIDQRCTDVELLRSWPALAVLNQLTQDNAV